MPAALESLTVECLQNALRRDCFPPADLQVNPHVIERAEELLDEVAGEIRSLPSDVRHYFQVSSDRYQFALQWMIEQPRGRVLDLGCAPGHLAMALTNAGFNVYGTDVSADYVKKYPSPWVARLKLIQVAIENERVPYADEYFDYVLFMDVLEHIAVTNPLRILAELRRLLKPGGVILLSTPNVCYVGNALALLNGHNIYWEPSAFYGGLDRRNRLFTPNEVKCLLEASGFRRVRIGYANTPANENGHTFEEVNALRKQSNDGEEHPAFHNTIFAAGTK